MNTTPTPRKGLRVDSLTTQAIASSAHPHYLLQELLDNGGLDAVYQGISEIIDRTQANVTVEQIRGVIDTVMAERNAPGATIQDTRDVEAAPPRPPRSLFAPTVDGVDGVFPPPKARLTASPVEDVVWEVTDSVLDLEAVHAAVFLVRTQMVLQDWSDRRISTLDAAGRVAAAVADRPANGHDAPPASP